MCRWRGTDFYLHGAGKTSGPGGTNTWLPSVNQARPRPPTAERRGWIRSTLASGRANCRRPWWRVRLAWSRWWLLPLRNRRHPRCRRRRALRRAALKPGRRGSGFTATSVHRRGVSRGRCARCRGLAAEGDLPRGSLGPERRPEPPGPNRSSRKSINARTLAGRCWWLR